VVAYVPAVDQSFGGLVKPTDKPYGRRIWQSLPPMKRTREERDAVEFLRNLARGM